MKLPTSGTTAALGRQGLAATLGASLCVLVLVAALALAQDPASLLARLEALRSLATLGPAIVGTLGLVATGGTVAHGARHIGGPPAPTTGELLAKVEGEVPA